jgi:hypothetical protein
MPGQELGFTSLLASLKEVEALAGAAKALREEGENPASVLELYRASMKKLGRELQAGKYSLPEIVMAGEMLERMNSHAGALPRSLLYKAFFHPQDDGFGEIDLGTWLSVESFLTRIHKVRTARTC